MVNIYKIKLIDDIVNIINTYDKNLINFKNTIKIKNNLYINGIQYDLKDQEIYIITNQCENIQWFFRLEYFDENILQQIISEMKNALN